MTSEELCGQWAGKIKANSLNWSQKIFGIKYNVDWSLEGWDSVFPVYVTHSVQNQVPAYFFDMDMEACPTSCVLRQNFSWLLKFHTTYSYSKLK